MREAGSWKSEDGRQALKVESPKVILRGQMTLKSQEPRAKIRIVRSASTLQICYCLVQVSPTHKAGLEDLNQRGILGVET